MPAIRFGNGGQTNAIAASKPVSANETAFGPDAKLTLILMITRKDQTTHDPTGSAPPTCWQREGQAPCLRLELPSGETHVIPYAHFLTASIQPAKNAIETLCISFSICQIEIDGHGLRELLLTLEDLAVKWIRTAPERYRGVIGRDSGVISDIRITDLRDER